MRNLTYICLAMVMVSCNGNAGENSQWGSKQNRASPAPLQISGEATGGIIYFSVNDGLTWECRSDGLPDSVHTGLGAIATSGNSIALSTKENGIFLFDFQMNRWIQIPTDPQIIECNPGALVFYRDQICVGTQFGGVFSSADSGKNWINMNRGLADHTIRRLVQVDGKLYAGTNSGLYSYDELLKSWELEYGNSTLQVNGITGFGGGICIGTNQGAFSTPRDRNRWTQILADRALHNIGSDRRTIYAMTYNELLSSVDNGQSWQSIQKGLPDKLYTFNVIKKDHALFAGQWDGVYRKDDPDGIWRSSSNGLPDQFAISNMVVYNDIIVVCGSHRDLKKGLTAKKTGDQILKLPNF